ncbi:tetratricopeptide repeat protein [Galbitalea sp. SE-J8]|uniref:co-chaperone YbbN n=1 Tax=Galbitalea sp. SE-J8 TaxID=3054952 RepID=UPI00259CF1A6|nr:tetratricopeptide repeat protein [Galbitalea sp. SE-J8]MDM4764342.1 tetratricopeptide repeat protein [Galbitalea sp. SE-J8]
MTNVPPSAANLRGAIDLSPLVANARRADAPAAPGAPGAAPAGAAGAASVVVATTDADFQGVVELSTRVPVIVEFYGAGVQAQLAALVTAYGGRLVLATVDGAANPQLAQAFQVAEVPAVAALIGGRPLQLFVGLPDDAQIRQVFDQVLQVAAQQGVTGTVPVDGAPADGGDAEPVEEPLPPHHQAAYDAIAAGDFATAIHEYQTAIAQDPRDQLAVAGLAQVQLLDRLAGADAAALREAAAAAPASAAAQLAVADLDVSGGHVEDAFARLLDLFPTLDADGKALVRARLVDYFELVGADDPRVSAARRRLTSLLY